MKLSTALLLAAAFLAGCTTSQQTITSDPIYNSRSGVWPLLNDVSTTDAGKLLFKEFDYKVSPTIKLHDDCRTSKATIPGDKKLIAVKINNSRAYVYLHEDGSEYGELYYLADRNSNDKIDHYKTFSGSWVEIDPEIKYSSSKSVLSKDFGYQFELVYLGIEGGIMEVLYREFREDYTKPASTQVLGYEINPKGPTVIAYKGAKIKVLQTTADDVEYKVLASFE